MLIALKFNGYFVFTVVLILFPNGLGKGREAERPSERERTNLTRLLGYLCNQDFVFASGIQPFDFLKLYIRYSSAKDTK